VEFIFSKIDIFSDQRSKRASFYFKVF